MLYEVITRGNHPRTADGRHLCRVLHRAGLAAKPDRRACMGRLGETRRDDQALVLGGDGAAGRDGRDLPGNRITSYNVCYTKLLRPVTYVPARNTILLSLALGWAEVLEARHIFIGANAVDYSGYPDCRPEYLRAFEAMANLATKAALEGRRIEIRAPLIDLV